MQPQDCITSILKILPIDCIASILSRTTAEDACRFSIVSKTCQDIADSDGVWRHFLPSDHASIVSQFRLQYASIANARSKKALYLALSNQPLIFDEGRKSFQLDRKSGKKCYMLAARDLSIGRGEDENLWQWITFQQSRFGEVAKLGDAHHCDFHGLLNTNALSQNTQYATYLVFSMIDAEGFENLPMKLSVSITDGPSHAKKVCLDSNLVRHWLHYDVDGLERPTVKGDGGLEIEMGEFYNSGLEDKELRMSFFDLVGGNWKRGIRIEGMEVRPKNY